MFNSKKKSYARETCTKTINSYGEYEESFTTVNNIDMFVSLQQHDEVLNNGVQVQGCTHVGVTSDAVTIGDRINNKWLVQFINTAGRESIVFMKEIDSDVF